MHFVKSIDVGLSVRKPIVVSAQHTRYEAIGLPVAGDKDYAMAGWIARVRLGATIHNLESVFINYDLKTIPIWPSLDHSVVGNDAVWLDIAISIKLLAYLVAPVGVRRTTA
jgi:hypothetical protein